MLYCQHCYNMQWNPIFINNALDYPRRGNIHLNAPPCPYAIAQLDIKLHVNPATPVQLHCTGKEVSIEMQAFSCDVMQFIDLLPRESRNLVCQTVFLLLFCFSCIFCLDFFFYFYYIMFFFF